MQSVSEDSISSMLDFVTSQPRSAQLLAFKNNKFVQSLRGLLARYISISPFTSCILYSTLINKRCIVPRYTHETALFSMKPDKRDANLVLYDSTSATMVAYE
jgi:hypothetical protein